MKYMFEYLKPLPNILGASKLEGHGISLFITRLLNCSTETNKVCRINVEPKYICYLSTRIIYAYHEPCIYTLTRLKYMYINLI